MPRKSEPQNPQMLRVTKQMRELLPHYENHNGTAVSNAAFTGVDIFLSRTPSGYHVAYYGDHPEAGREDYWDLTWEEAVALVVAFKLQYGD